MKILAFLFGLLVASSALAAGSQGLTYTTYIGGGPSPSIVNRTVLTTGILSSVNYDWGGGGVLNTGRADGVIVHVTGFIQAPNTGTYYFGTTSDDGTILTVNGVTLVNCWCEQGPTFRYGAIDLTAGQVVPIDLWYYENGGGAVLQLFWYTGAGWQIMPTSMTATDSTYWQPTLCCGGSSAPFNANTNNVALVNGFGVRSTNDSQVYIQQVGDNNTITVNQTGTKNNYAYISNSGSFNTINTTQSGNASTVTNYSYNMINGNNNTIGITQTSTGGSKASFVTVQNNSNTIDITQTDSGNHYAEVGVSGSNKSVSVTQKGSANHMTSVQLSGNPTSLILEQTGSTQNFYSLQFNCATVGGCAPISVKQGN